RPLSTSPGRSSPARRRGLRCPCHHDLCSPDGREQRGLRCSLPRLGLRHRRRQRLSAGAASRPDRHDGGSPPGGRSSSLLPSSRAVLPTFPICQASSRAGNLNDGGKLAPRVDLRHSNSLRELTTLENLNSLRELSPFLSPPRFPVSVGQILRPIWIKPSLSPL